MTKEKIFMEEIVGECGRSLRLARKNYYLASFFIIVSIISSFLAAISIANGDSFFSNFQLALLAAIPGTVLTFNSKLKNEEKSKWHYAKYHKLNSLRREFEFNGLDLEKATRALNLIFDDTEKQYPGFGNEDEPGRG